MPLFLLFRCLYYSFTIISIPSYVLEMALELYGFGRGLGTEVFIHVPVSSRLLFAALCGLQILFHMLPVEFKTDFSLQGIIYRV